MGSGRTCSVRAIPISSRSSAPESPRRSGARSVGHGGHQAEGIGRAPPAQGLPRLDLAAIASAAATGMRGARPSRGTARSAPAGGVGSPSRLTSAVAAIRTGRAARRPPEPPRGQQFADVAGQVLGQDRPRVERSRMATDRRSFVAGSGYRKSERDEFRPCFHPLDGIARSERDRLGGGYGSSASARSMEAPRHRELATEAVIDLPSRA